jgi:hypothetical protein
LIAALQERFHGKRFQVLFGVLALTLVAGPALRALAFEAVVLEALLLLTLLAAGLGGLGLGRGRGILALALVLAVLRVALGGEAGTLLLAAGDVLWTLALVLASVASLRVALREGTVTRERLYAATSFYLLAGLAFAAIYHGLWQLDPGALRAAGDPSLAPDLATAVYFSFVTLATLGYGDVVPVTPLARSLAISEAVGAQLFVAVLIARLVSLQARPRADEPGAD